jgi:hypothetical protein
MGENRMAVLELSKNEIELLRSICVPIKQLALENNESQKVIQKRFERLMKKLNIPTKENLLVLALRNKWIELNDLRTPEIKNEELLK